MAKIKLVPRRTSQRTGDAIWMKFECGAGSRWVSTVEDATGTVCNFSGCNCGTRVRFMGETDDRREHWFGLRAGAGDNSRTAVGAYINTSHKTIDELIALAKSRAVEGERPDLIVQDIIDGYNLGWQTANCGVIQKAVYEQHAN